MKSLLVVCIVVMCLSCDAPPNRDNLNPMVRYMADTMFAHRRRDIDIKMDSLCALHIDQYRQTAIDSLLLIEQKRIEELSE